MPRLGTKHHGRNIIREHKFLMVIPVEQKHKVHIGMVFCDAFQRLVTEPANAFKFIL